MWIPSLFYALWNVVASLINLFSAALTLHSIFLCQPAYLFLFWERSVILLLWRSSLLCVTMYDKRSSFFKVTVRAKETCDPGAFVLVDVWSNLVMSQTPPFFVLFVYMTVEERISKKRMRESVKREQEFHFAALLPVIVLYCTFLNYQCLWFLPTLCNLSTPAVLWSGNSRGKRYVAQSHRLWNYLHLHLVHSLDSILKTNLS